MAKEIEIGDNKQFIQDILLRLFEKICIMSYSLKLERKQKKEDGDIQYLSIYFAYILFHKRVPIQKLTELRNQLVESSGIDNENTLIYRMNESYQEFNEWYSELEFTVKDSLYVTNRITQLLKTKHLSHKLGKTKIIAGSNWILSRFITSIEAAPGLIYPKDTKRGKRLLESDYILYMLFFGLLKKHVNEAQGNTKKNIIMLIDESLGHVLDVKNLSKYNPLISTGDNKILYNLFGKKDIFFSIADNIYNTPHYRKNDVMHYLLQKKKIFFLKEFQLI